MKCSTCLVCCYKKELTTTTFPSFPSPYSPLERLPPHLLLEILNRVNDSTDIARCKLVCKTLYSICQDLKFINLKCYASRYRKGRTARERKARSRLTPFKTIFLNLVHNSRNLESVFVGLKESNPPRIFRGEDRKDDDMYLMDVGFVNEWLPGVCDGLRSLSIWNFWHQASWRKSDVLALISLRCHRLVELELKNAWLTLDNISPMLALKSLTLRRVKFYYEDFNKINDCFPSLQILNLIGVGGLTETKMRLLHLEECYWKLLKSDVHSLAIHAPSLKKLELSGFSLRSLFIEASILSEFHLTLEKVDEFSVQTFSNLETFLLESQNLGCFIRRMPSETVKHLTVDLLKCYVETIKFDPETLFDAFPNLSSLTVGPGVWLALETWRKKETTLPTGNLRMKKLQEIVARMVVYDVEVTYSLISYILYYTNLPNVALLIHRSINHNIARGLITRCMVNYPKVRWRWGTWKEKGNDVWMQLGF